MVDPSKGKKHAEEKDAEDGQKRLHLPLSFLWRSLKAMVWEQADALSIATASFASDLDSA